VQAARRRRIALNQHPPSNEESNVSRKAERYTREQEQQEENRRFEVIEDVDPGMAAIAAGEQRHREAMLNPDTAPEWARVIVTGHQMAPDAKVALSRLAADEAEATRLLNEAQARTKAILDAHEAEERKLAVDAEAKNDLPAKLRTVLQGVNEFQIEAAKDDPIRRGQDALARAQRRLNGEVVPEPEFVPMTPAALPLNERREVLRARCAPALAEAARIQIALDAWARECGTSIESLHVPEDEDQRHAIDALMLGLPPVQANLLLVTGVLRSVRETLKMKTVVAQTLDRETRNLERIIARIEDYGAPLAMGDTSSGAYQLEREIVGALTALGTASQDSIDALWVQTKSITERLERIAAIRAQHAGTPVEKLQWEANRGLTADAAVEAARNKETMSVEEPGEGSRWSVFDKVSDKLRGLRGEG
jgi:hypothetical protein